MNSEAFKEAYKKLNPKQQEAVDSIEGPVMVIAGPGTGKTQILALRIANILQAVEKLGNSSLIRNPLPQKANLFLIRNRNRLLPKDSLSLIRNPKILTNLPDKP